MPGAAIIASELNDHYRLQNRQKKAIINQPHMAEIIKGQTSGILGPVRPDVNI